MNISSQEPDLVTAKTCGCKKNEQITYAFSESSHGLCLSKKDIIEAEINACERLSKYSANESERRAVDRETAELRMALDLLT